MRRASVIKLAATAVAVVSILWLLAWAGTIREITVVEHDKVEAAVTEKMETCLGIFKGQSLWSLGTKEVQQVVAGCDPIVKSSSIRSLFPGRLEVAITYFHPWVKIEGENGTCVLLENSTRTASLPTERCVWYKLPVLMGTGIESKVFVQEYAVELARTLSDVEIQIESIEYKGEPVAPWYILKLSEGKYVNFPSSASVLDKVTILAASIKGLNAAEERYTTIDVRFDRVTYK